MIRFLILCVFFINISCRKVSQETSNKKEVLVDRTIDTVNIETEISICENSKRDINLYKEFIDEKKMVYINSMKNNNLYYHAEKKYFEKLFDSKNINCIVSLVGNGYNIFDINYNNILAEKIFNKIIEINKNRGKFTNDYHDFFKRGMVFILNRDVNKITVITINPFYDNKMPEKLKSYFSKNNTKYDRVIMTIGIGYLEVLI